MKDQFSTLWAISAALLIFLPVITLFTVSVAAFAALPPFFISIAALATLASFTSAQFLPLLSTSFFVLFMSSDWEVLLTKLSSQSIKMIWIPDPSKFYANALKNKVLYKDWLLQIQNKVQTNESYMPTKFLKKSYMQSHIADNALAQISIQLENNAAQLFKIAKKMLDMLTAAFGNKNQ